MALGRTNMGGGRPQKPETTFTVTPSLAQQTLTPPEGYVYSGGIVNAMPVSGSMDIALDGTYDVTYKASVNVEVIKDVTSVPYQKYTDVIYNTTNNSYYVWED